MTARLVVNSNAVGTGILFEKHHPGEHVAIAAARALGYPCTHCSPTKADKDNRWHLHVGSVRLVTVEVT